jgi:peptidoglycan/LPS O-acetylase OafA/YrhL
MLDPQTFAGNVLMLQDYFVTPLGSNQPLWTISAEFWFYAVFLSALGGYAIARTLPARRASLVPLAAILLLLGPKFLSLLLLWTIGVAIVVVPTRWALRPLFAGLIFLAVLLVARWQGSFFDLDANARYFKDLAVAISFAHLVIAMRGRRYAWLERVHATNAFMAGFSYSLYLLHFPLMLFLLGLLHATGWFPGIAHGYLPTEPAGLLAYALTIAAVFTLVWLFSLLTERRTLAVRRFLKSRLPGLLPSFFSLR